MHCTKYVCSTLLFHYCCRPEIHDLTLTVMGEYWGIFTIMSNLLFITVQKQKMAMYISDWRKWCSSAWCKSELIFFTVMTSTVSVASVARSHVTSFVAVTSMSTNNFSRARRCANNHPIRRRYSLGFSCGSRHADGLTDSFRAVDIEFVSLRFRAHSTNSSAAFFTDLATLRFVVLLVHFTTVMLFHVFRIAVWTAIEIPSVPFLLADLHRNRFISAYSLRVNIPHFAASRSANWCALLEIAIVLDGFYVGFFVTLLKSIATFRSLWVACFSWLPCSRSSSNQGQTTDDNSRFHCDRFEFINYVREYSREPRGLMLDW